MFSQVVTKVAESLENLLYVSYEFLSLFLVPLYELLSGLSHSLEDHMTGIAERTFYISDVLASDCAQW